MANQDWENLGRDIQNVIDRAVSSRDFQQLNQTIRQVVDRVVDIGGASEKPQKEQPQKDLPALYAGTGPRTAAGVAKIVCGGLLSGVTLLGMLASAFMEMMVGVGGAPGVVSIALFGGGVGLICGGINSLGRINRFKAYRKVLGMNTCCALDKLARAVGKNVKFVRRELRQMIDGGLFLEGHMDREETYLITSHETYRNFEESRLQLQQRRAREEAEARQTEGISPQAREVLRKGDEFIRQLRRCNDAIPGEVVSGKIDKMEQILQRIFQRVKTDPSVIPELKKMMDYYLPMTVKLLDAYADMDAQPVQGQTILNSKREIEQSLDTLNQAYEKLLDDLFADTALDVSSDISVLRTLLAQEGLAADELQRMKHDQNI